ncbi:MarR family winged helix-turn-helix transcriptional regulator [Brevundimonas huaxiensis]|uniref:MarR family winged helix-turn-helix transcriptional regulator n=1 Tax=Brevundimonas huaxiensis TaxID=2725493 RepID=UPI001F2FB6D5|nr:helix-turn-helix domain-containing protein [Brevundimonas huaxiensis]
MRHLIDLLDGEVEAAYAASGLHWRPRYTPILRVLMRDGGQSIKTIAQQIGISHSAVSQTVTQMVKDELVLLKPGAVARERIVMLTAKTEAMIPRLQRQWSAVNQAAETLDQELSAPLSGVVKEAIAALTDQPFRQRIQAAAKTQSAP